MPKTEISMAHTIISLSQLPKRKLTLQNQTKPYQTIPNRTIWANRRLPAYLCIRISLCITIIQREGERAGGSDRANAMCISSVNVQNNLCSFQYKIRILYHISFDCYFNNLFNLAIPLSHRCFRFTSLTQYAFAWYLFIYQITFCMLGWYDPSSNTSPTAN